MSHKESILLGKDEISFEIGKWAKQADGSVVYKTGNLVLLATVCGLDEPKENQDFFPLSCDYIEKMYSVGKIPGGYIKREARPSENEILISRMIDRSIRPMFPDGYFADVQILVQVLSADKLISTSGHAITAASCALFCSKIPFPKPIAGVRIGRINKEWILNPSNQDILSSDVDLVVSATEDTIVMIEGEAKEISNQELIEGIEFAHNFIKELSQFQQNFLQKLNVEKKQISLISKDLTLFQQVKSFCYKKMEEANKSSDKNTRDRKIKLIKKETLSYFEKQDISDVKPIHVFLEEIEYDVVRNLVLNENIRADGRKPDEIRNINCEINTLPALHGSAVFTRGQTQSLATITLGTYSDNQKYNTIEGQKEKNFVLHYNFLSFSVGEVGRLTGPGRREIGHGNLSERSLKCVLPAKEDFSYSIRVVSEILESNGSSSMATVCSSSLALMSAGVPIHSSVAGIAMGMISNQEGKSVILSDIAGLEDHFGDMDCKIAGTRKGITGFQMDCKMKGLDLTTLAKIFEQAEKGRFHILDQMELVIKESEKDISKNAPRIIKVQIPEDKIGEFIGPSGKNIKALIEETNVSDISIESNGLVTILSEDSISGQEAALKIEKLFEKVEVGKTYEGIVKRITDFGAFIEFLPGKEGLCHISKIAHKRIGQVSDVLSKNQKINVRVMNIDVKGRTNLSIKDAKTTD